MCHHGHRQKNWLARANLLYYKDKIFFFCYVLLLISELGLSISSDFFRTKKLLFTPLVFLFNFLLRQFIFYLIFT